MLNEVFSQNFNSAIPPLNQADSRQFIVNPSTTTSEAILCTEEVMGILLAIDTSKASGPDGISGIMLKSTALSIAPSVTKLLNLLISNGSIPHKWKISSVVPIPKSSASTDNPSNYTPICLLPVISKLLERHIYSVVLEHLIEREILTENQWRFTPGKSTVTALLSSFHNIFELLESGTDVSLVFF